MALSALVGLVVVAATVAVSVLLVQLDQRIRAEFEGRRWSVPARIYARPLELYPGAQLTPRLLERELELLRYQAVAEPREAGTYRVDGARVTVVPRPFTHLEGREHPGPITLTFRADSVRSITRAGGGPPVYLARLDPVQVGSFFPTHGEDRILVRREQVPPFLVMALLAVEDQRFFRHLGLEPRGILRALVVNIRAGRTVQGGSTLTQQLVKNYFLTSERTLKRKAIEALMALLLEWHYDKHEILEAYLNEVFLGQQGRRAIHGFGLASQFYFDKPLESLAPEQLALLAGLVRGPSYYAPRRHPERARQRRDQVLALMGAQGYLSAERVRALQARPLRVTPSPPKADTLYPAFMDLVRRHLQRDYRQADLRSAGLRVFTTLDPLAQWAAERAVQDRLARLEAAGPLAEGTLEAASVVTRADDTAEVLAVVGGRAIRFAGFNRALDARRQIGSLVKPAVYLAALSQPKSFTLATRLKDAPFEYRYQGQLWTPKNYDDAAHGDVVLYRALAKSYNLATARLGLSIELGPVIETLQRLGLERRVEPYPSLLLGSLEATPLEIAQVYHTLSAGGFHRPLQTIRGIQDRDGRLLRPYPLRVQQRLDGDTVFLVNSALTRVVSEGTARYLTQRLDPALTVAGKTGTTDGLRDSWFAGFTGNLLAVVWVGRDDNGSARLTGSSGALRVWADLVSEVPLTSWAPKPSPRIRFAWIDADNGLRAAEGCPDAVRLPFVRGSELPGPSPRCAVVAGAPERGAGVED